MKISDDSSIKRARRGELRRVLRKLDPAFCHEASLSITEKLREWVGSDSRTTGTALFYAALPGEPDVWPLFGNCPGWTFALPRVLETEPKLECRRICDRERDLVAGRFGIFEPDPETCPLVPIEALDVIIVPALGYTPTGERLGKGGGYYDRLLGFPERRGRAIGVCFDCQITDSLPTEPHDQRVDLVVTESRMMHAEG